jgi:hypothetical protein
VLIVPPMRIEWAKAGRTRVRRIGNIRSAEFEVNRMQSEAELTREIEEEHEWDAYLLIVRGVLLAGYFILQIPSKMEMVNRGELTQELNKLKTEMLNPVKQ